MVRLSISLITVTLMAAMVGCAAVQYDLTVSSTEGGEVTTPGEATFTYNKGTVVNLVAEPEEGYHFVNWTGEVGNIANVNSATTTTIMNGDYSILANFGLEIWEIRDWYDLDAIRNNMGGSYILMNDLDSTTASYEELASSTANQGKGWQPIGTPANPFTGTFNGQGYEIRDLFVNRPAERDVGLFGAVGEEGVIKDIGVVNADVTGQWYVGSLVGTNYGTVSNSYSTGSVSGDEDVGGLVGYSEGTVSNSFWDIQSSGQTTSAGGTGKTTAEMKDIATFSGAAWDIIAVNPSQTNLAHIWNIVDDETYPFLSWES